MRIAYGGDPRSAGCEEDGQGRGGGRTWIKSSTNAHRDGDHECLLRFHVSGCGHQIHLQIPRSLTGSNVEFVQAVPLNCKMRHLTG